MAISYKNFTNGKKYWNAISWKASDVTVTIIHFDINKSADDDDKTSNRGI
jgi:hypothetical protein